MDSSSVNFVFKNLYQGTGRDKIPEMEQGSNTEALKVLPFREVALPMVEALALLTDRTRMVVKTNIGELIKQILPVTPNYEDVVAHYRRKQDEVESIFGPGGFALTPSDLEFIYEEWGHLTYQGVMERIVGESVPKYFNDKESDKSQNIASSCVGYILDTLRLIKPEVASFDDGVKIVVESMRNTGYKLAPFELGVMIDDVSGRKNIGDQPIDLWADAEGASLLGASYLTHANPRELASFNRGLQITRAELHQRATGFSIN